VRDPRRIWYEPYARPSLSGSRACTGNLILPKGFILPPSPAFRRRMLAADLRSWNDAVRSRDAMASRTNLLAFTSAQEGGLLRCPRDRPVNCERVVLLALACFAMLCAAAFLRASVSRLSVRRIRLCHRCFEKMLIVCSPLLSNKFRERERERVRDYTGAGADTFPLLPGLDTAVTHTQHGAAAGIGYSFHTTCT